jgi:hypothetical protein
MSRRTFSLAIAILCGSAAHAQEIVLPVAPVPTPADETLPVSLYDCSLTHVNGEKLSFKFQVSGGRGYKLDGRVTRTGTEVTVLSDPAHVFDGYVLGSWDGRELRGLNEAGDGFFGESFVGDIRQSGQALTDDFSGRVLMTVGEHRPPRAGMDPYFTATGFCDAVSPPQQPLSEPEVAELDTQ